ncbi:MAG TPA: cytochrome b5 [Desulfobacteraceae bacterium]|nr:cytochrome b5 [Desulfobacteraceae bacterium]
MKKFDLEELSQFNGKEGSPAYVAYQGRVIDVSESKLWKGGLHMKRHHAGNDLTRDIKGAPHGPEMLERYPQAGVLEKGESSERELPGPLSWLLDRVPMLRRHPHPMTVHFPIVFMFSTTMFNVLYLVTGFKAFEITALHCLGAGILFTPVAILTGLYTWWLNYLAKPIKAVSVKIRASPLLFAVQIAVFLWRLLDPGILDSLGFASTLYFLLVLSLFILVTIIGWFGASMTFPVEGE